ncbi:MAG: M55 family metallopeptidase [Caldisericia bacterium]|nr:M55 family metallopeptidase [Caldisericia bacterium]
MKIFISVDMEGISGLTYWKEKEEKIEKFMTDEVLAVIDGIKDFNKEAEVVLCDSHAYGRNLDIKRIYDDVKIISGYPREFYMISGIDDSFDAGMFIGYHAPVGSLNGEMDHTYSSSTIFEVKINGISIGEAEINGAFLGEYNIPVVLISGDDKLKNFSQKFFPQTKFVITKESLGRFSAKLYHPDLIHKILREEAKNSLKEIKNIKPLKFDKPIKIEITFINTLMAEFASLIPFSKRVDGRTISFESTSFKEIYNFLMASLSLAYNAKNF